MSLADSANKNDVDDDGEGNADENGQSGVGKDKVDDELIVECQLDEQEGEIVLVKQEKPFTI